MAAQVFTGFEFGTTAGIATGNAGNRVFDISSGTVSMSTTTPRSGTYSMQAALTAANYVGWDTNSLGSSQTALVGSFYFYVSTDPTSGTIFAYIGTAAAAESLGFEYFPTENQIHLWCPITSTGAFSTATVNPGEWTRVDYRLNVSANPWTFDWKVNGVAETQFTVATTATTVATWRMGCPFSGFTGTFRYDDVVLSTTSGDFPLGQHDVKILVPTAASASDGGTDFRTFTNNGTISGSWNNATALGAVDEIPPTISASADGAVQITTDTTNHMIFDMDTYALASGETLSGVRLLAPGWATSTTSATIGFRSHNGAAESTLFTTADPNFNNSTTNPAWMCKLVPNITSQSELNALQFRIGFSGDAAPDIGVHAVYAEIAVKVPSGKDVFPDPPATATSTANNTTSLVSSGIQGVTVSASANNPTVSTGKNVDAIEATSTVSAGNLTATVTSGIQAAAATAAAQNATVSTSKDVSPTEAAATASAQGASISTSISRTPTEASATTTAQDAAVSTSKSVPATEATATASAMNTTATVRLSTLEAAGTASANDATVSSSGGATNVTPQVANATGTANATQAEIRPTANQADSTGAAQDTDTTGSTTPVVATATGTANDPQRSIFVNGGVAEAVAEGAQQQPPSPDAALASGTAYAPQVEVKFSPSTANVATIVDNPGVTVGTLVNAGEGSAQGEAHNPSQRIDIPSIIASATATGSHPGVTGSTTPGEASATASANNATVDVSSSGNPTAQTAESTALANDATVSASLSVTPEVASSTASANDATVSTSTNVTPGVAGATATASGLASEVEPEATEASSSGVSNPPSLTIRFTAAEAMASALAENAIVDFSIRANPSVASTSGSALDARVNVTSNIQAAQAAVIAGNAIAAVFKYADALTATATGAAQDTSVTRSANPQAVDAEALAVAVSSSAGIGVDGASAIGSALAIPPFRITGGVENASSALLVTAARTSSPTTSTKPHSGTLTSNTSAPTLAGNRTSAPTVSANRTSSNTASDG